MLAITLGKSLQEIGAMSARDRGRLRRFYARHPFGPLRGDMQAWLAGSQARTGFGGKPMTLETSLGMFCFPSEPKRKRKSKPPAKANMSGEKLKTLAMLHMAATGVGTIEGEGNGSNIDRQT